MKKEAIILAGGFGTRLKDTVPSLPKCLAPVKGKPLLSYIINYLLDNKIHKIIFSLYYKSELVIEYVKSNFNFINYEFVIEKDPMGTGGALALALEKTNTDNIVVLNGDSVFKIELDNFYEFHNNMNSSFSIALKKMPNPYRYGTVNTNKECKIICFNEKDESLNNGIINGGIYIVNKTIFLKEIISPSFSLENDYLAISTKKKNIFGKTFDEYFIDIGVPDDYKRANIEL